MVETRTFFVTNSIKRLQYFPLAYFVMFVGGDNITKTNLVVLIL